VNIIRSRISTLSFHRRGSTGAALLIYRLSIINALARLVQVAFYSSSSDIPDTAHRLLITL